MSIIEYPSPEELLLEKKGRSISFDAPYEYAIEIGKFPEELSENQYLWTWYRYEVDTKLTTDSYLDWVDNKKPQFTAAESALKSTGFIVPTRDVIELVPTYKSSIIAGGPNVVSRFARPYGNYQDKEALTAIRRILTYNRHLLIQNDQSINLALKLLLTGQLNEMTHVVYGNKEEYDYYSKVMQDLWRKLNGEEYHTSLAGEKYSKVSGINVLTKTYKRNS